MKRLTFPGIVILAWAVIALLGPVLPLEPDRIELVKILGTPQWQAWLGYDDLGRSIGQRLIMGARTSFLVAFTVVVVSFLLGTLMGMLGAWFGGPWDKGLVSIIDIFMAFPGILLAIALAGLLGPGLINAVIALAVTGWVGFARLARAQTLSMKHRDHVVAARALGSSTVTIVLRHLFPLILSPLVIEATFAIAAVVIAEASLSFLGLGVQPPDASWGSMIRDGTRYMLVAPHMVIAPGLAIFLVVIAINQAGDRLRDAMDSRGHGA